MGELDNPPIDLTPSPPAPPTQNFFLDVDCNCNDFHEVISPRPPSFNPFGPIDFGLLCSFVLNPSCDVHED